MNSANEIERLKSSGLELRPAGDCGQGAELIARMHAVYDEFFKIGNDEDFALCFLIVLASVSVAVSSADAETVTL
jgi:hypothetical protein